MMDLLIGLAIKKPLRRGTHPGSLPVTAAIRVFQKIL